MDLNAIADNLALKYATLPAPSGYTQGMRGATADPPDTIDMPPYVVVTASIENPATFEYGAQTRLGTIPFNVDIFIDKASNTPRQMRLLQAWVPSLVDITLIGVHLSLPFVVASSWTESFQIGDLLYAGQKYAGVRLVVIVRISEPIAPTA